MPSVPSSPLLRFLRGIAGQDTARLADAQLLERFLFQHDPSAFETLMRRHGAMVLGVCRRVLNNDADSEDAFQATFLVLVRKAGTITKRETVGGWLHGVAYKTALKARAANERRRTTERKVGEMDRRGQYGEEDETELLAILDRELNALPDKYRLPIVLCDLEGKSHKEAAKELRWPEGTLSGRLSRARALLAQRVKRHGMMLSCAGAVLATAVNAASASVPPSIVSATVRAAACPSLAQAVAGNVLSAQVAALAESVLRSMLLAKLKIAALVLLTAGLLAAGAVSRAVSPLVVGVPSTSAQPAQPAPQPKTFAAAARPAESSEAERARATEDAVADGFQWLLQQQQRDGRWRLAPGNRKRDTAATALALLPLLEAGESPKSRGALHPYARAVERGLQFLMEMQEKSGFIGPDMYSHALAARALCEAYRLTEHPAYRQSTQRAIDLIAACQDDKGGWRYSPVKQPGDTSVTSYQILVLVAARHAGLHVPEATRTAAAAFLDSVVSPKRDGYGYTPGIGKAPTPKMTAAGHLCRLALGGKGDEQGIVRWAAKVRAQPFPKDESNLYYFYFVTQALELRGGKDWETWEKRVRAHVLARQDHGEQHAHERGSWAADRSSYNSAGGRLLATSLALLTLQTCARTDKLPKWPSRELKGRELAELYAALRDKDFVAARRAVRTLAASPEDSVPFLGIVLQPTPLPDAQRLKRLIADLDSDSFAVRRQASAELEKLAELAHPALHQALEAHPTLEARRRIEQVLEATNLDNSTAAQRQATRAVEVLVQADTPQARRLLKKLAQGAPMSVLTLAAQEGLERLSKHANPDPRPKR